MGKAASEQVEGRESTASDSVTLSSLRLSRIRTYAAEQDEVSLDSGRERPPPRHASRTTPRLARSFRKVCTSGRNIPRALDLNVHGKRDSSTSAPLQAGQRLFTHLFHPTCDSRAPTLRGSAAGGKTKQELTSSRGAPRSTISSVQVNRISCRAAKALYFQRRLGRRCGAGILNVYDPWVP